MENRDIAIDNIVYALLVEFPPEFADPIRQLQAGNARLESRLRLAEEETRP